MREKTSNKIGEEIRGIFEGVSDGILVSNTKTKGFVYANSRVCELTGYSKQELMRLNAAKIHPKKDLASVVSQFERQAAGEQTIAPCVPVLRKDKTVLYCDVTASTVKVGNQKLLVRIFRDISEQRRIEGILPESPEQFKTFFEYAPDALYLNDLKGVFVDGNQAAEKMTGYRRDELIGSSFLELNLLERGQKLKAASLLAKNILGKSTGPDDFVLNRKDGSKVSVEIMTYPVKLNGKVLVLGVGRDITQRKRTEEIISYMAYHDLLTNLPNRRLFREHLLLELAQAQRKEQRLAVALLDIDNFKDINDTLGHPAGDKVLQILAARLKSVLRKSDSVARWGGDEFILSLPEITRAEDVDKIIRRVLRKVSRTFIIDEHHINTTVSIGVAIYPEGGTDIETLTKRADSAMYQAKGRDGNNCQLYRPTMNCDIVR